MIGGKRPQPLFQAGIPLHAALHPPRGKRQEVAPGIVERQADASLPDPSIASFAHTAVGQQRIAGLPAHGGHGHPFHRVFPFREDECMGSVACHVDVAFPAQQELVDDFLALGQEAVGGYLLQMPVGGYPVGIEAIGGGRPEPPVPVVTKQAEIARTPGGALRRGFALHPATVSGNRATHYAVTESRRPKHVFFSGGLYHLHRPCHAGRPVQPFQPVLSWGFQQQASAPLEDKKPSVGILEESCDRTPASIRKRTWEDFVYP